MRDRDGEEREEGQDEGGRRERGGDREVEEEGWWSLGYACAMWDKGIIVKIKII